MNNETTQAEKTTRKAQVIQACEQVEAKAKERREKKTKESS